MIDQLYTEQEISNHKRYCYGCKHELHYMGAKAAYVRIKDEEQSNWFYPPEKLVKLSNEFNCLWINDQIQFYCCNCYNYEIRKIKLEKRKKERNLVSPIHFDIKTMEFGAGELQNNDVSCAKDFIYTILNAYHIFEEYFYIFQPQLVIVLNYRVQCETQLNDHFSYDEGITELERIRQFPYVKSWKVDQELDNRIKITSMRKDYKFGFEREIETYHYYNDNPLRDITIQTGILQF